ncbi:MAG: VanZ family protein [Moraxella sp.]|nr:VanZ family protein [Moraxella sp.]
MTNFIHRPLITHTSKKWTIFAIGWFIVMMIKPSVSVSLSVTSLDKVGHIGLFFGQIWLLGRALIDMPDKQRWRWLMMVALCLALLSEGLQGLTATRSMQLGDVLADILGAVLALALLSWAKNKGYIK